MGHLDHPSPHFNDAKMARLLLRRAFIIALGGWGIIVPFYTVQDCRFGGIKRVKEEAECGMRDSHDRSNFSWTTLSKGKVQ